MCVKIGVLAPTSNHIEFKAQDIVKALELGLSEFNAVDFKLFIETAAYNADKNVVVGKMQELLVKQQVDVVVAPLNTGLLPYVNQLFDSQQVPLIINTLGEDVLFDEAQAPNTFVNSCNLWQSSWMCGYWGAANLGKKACSMAALHEGGYGMVFSFALGVEANAGELIQTAVTHRETRTQDPSESIKEISLSHPDFIMGLYSGKEALSFLSTYHELDAANKTPLMCLPFAVGEDMLNKLGEAALGIRSISCWRDDLAEYQNFERIFKRKMNTDRPPHAYALLAYETGHLIANAVRKIGTNQSVNGQLADALKNAEFTGPRGSIHFRSAAQETTTINYLREVATEDNGRYYNRVIAEIETPPLYYEQLILARKNLPKQGWSNPYLIT